MFNKKITDKDKGELVELINEVIVRPRVNLLHKRIDGLVEGIDFNGTVSGEILNFLLEQSGYNFYQENGEWTPKELKSLGKYKEFYVKGVKFLIANKKKVEGKKFDKVNKKGKK